MGEYNQDVNVHALTDAIAQALGEEWTCKPGHQNDGSAALLYGPDLEELFLAVDTHRKSNDGKIAITGSAPDGLRDHAPYDATWGAITVSHKRGSDAIARAIESRLLPGYHETLAATRENKRASDAYNQARAELLDQVLTALGEHGSRERDHTRHDKKLSDDKLNIGSILKGGVYGDVKILSDSVTFEIAAPRECAADLAAAIAAIAGQLAEKRKAQATT